MEMYKKFPYFFLILLKVKEYPTVPLPADKVVDTNGAGDSFVGGFLARFVVGSHLDECIAAGQYTAKDCIQHSGCNYSSKPDFKFK